MVTASAAVSALSAIVTMVTIGVLVLPYRPDANRYVQAESSPAAYHS